MKTEHLPAWLGGLLLLLAVLFPSACGPSTTFIASWTSPKAGPLNFKGELVAAVVMVTNDITRRAAEDALAGEITRHGAKGVPMYRIMSEPAEGNEAAARAAIERAGVKGVVVMRPKGKRKTTETHQTYTGPGYDGYGWGSAWGPAGYHGTPPGGVGTYTTTTEVTVVEVLVYSMKQNLLVWAGESESTPPEKVDEFVQQVAAEAVKELDRKGLISK